MTIRRVKRVSLPLQRPRSTVLLSARVGVSHSLKDGGIDGLARAGPAYDDCVGPASFDEFAHHFRVGPFGKRRGLFHVDVRKNNHVGIEFLTEAYRLVRRPSMRP